jgi:serine/threonine-protein kinase
MSTGTSSLPDLHGRVVGNYTLLEPLGSGATAQVYRARHRALLTDHAVKILRLRGKGMRRRAIQEGRVQARLRHPGIVAVTDVVLVDDHPALVGDYVPGPDLGRWLGDRPPREQRLAVFRGIVEAMGVAHSLGVVHRDMKPENVIIDLSGPEPRPRITDFGLARLLHDELREAAGARGPATQEGTILGTPAFMAPEQFSDASSVDERADIFALGCILYALLFDALPFPAHDLMAAAGAIQGGRYVRPFAREPGLAPNLAHAVEGCLETDRDQRTPDCASLLALLDGAVPPDQQSAAVPLSARSTLPRPGAAPGLELGTASPTLAPDDSERPTPPARLPARPILLGAGLDATTPTLAPPEALSAATPSPAALPSLVDDEVEPRRRSGILPVVVAAAVLVLVVGLGWWLMQGEAHDPVESPPLATVEAAPAPAAEPAVPPPDPAPALEPVAGAAAPEPAPERSPANTAARRRASSQPAAASESEASKTPSQSAKSADSPPAPETRPPDPTPVPATPSGVRVRVVDGTLVEFRRDGVAHRAGMLQEGRYAIYARFGDGPPVHAGDLSVTPGSELKISCSPDFQQCRSTR